MAGDWIKMRGALCTHPKVLMIAEIIGNDCEVGRRLSTGYNGALLQIVTRDVTRDIVIGCLLRVWHATNEHTDDGVWKNSTIDTIDSVAGVPGFGAAMASAGWAVVDEEKHTVSLPNFLEYNAPAKNGARSSAAERQARYRDRKRVETVTKDVTPPVTRDVTVSVTSVTREEKRRKKNPLPPAGSGEGDLPDWLNAEDWHRFVDFRSASKHPLTPEGMKLAISALAKLRSSGSSPKDVIEQSILNDWRGLFPIGHKMQQAINGHDGPRKVAV